MWKWAVRDYFTAFTWKKVKAVLGASWLLILEFGFVIPSLYGVFDNGRRAFAYLLCATITAYIVLSSEIHEIQLSKLMYLCPMTQRQRKKYVEAGMLFRICFEAVLGVGGTMVFFVGQFCDEVLMVSFIIDVIAFIISSGGFDRVLMDRKVRERLRPTQKFLSGALSTGNFIVTSISFLLKTVILTDIEIGITNILKWIFLGVALLVQLPLTIRLLCNWKQAVEKACSYEECF